MYTFKDPREVVGYLIKMEYEDSVYYIGNGRRLMDKPSGHKDILYKTETGIKKQMKRYLKGMKGEYKGIIPVYREIDRTKKPVSVPVSEAIHPRLPKKNCNQIDMRLLASVIEK